MPAASIIAGLTALASGVGKGVKAKKDNQRADALAGQERRDANQAELAGQSPAQAGVLAGGTSARPQSGAAISNQEWAAMQPQAAPPPPPAAAPGQIPMQGNQYGRRPEEDDILGRY